MVFGWVFLVCVSVFPLNFLFKFVRDQLHCPVISSFLNFCAGPFCVYFVWPDNKEKKVANPLFFFPFVDQWSAWTTRFFLLLIALLKQGLLDHPSCRFVSGNFSLSIWWLFLYTSISENGCPFLDSLQDIQEVLPLRVCMK